MVAAAMKKALDESIKVSAKAKTKGGGAQPPAHTTRANKRKTTDATELDMRQSTTSPPRSAAASNTKRKAVTASAVKPRPKLMRQNAVVGRQYVSSAAPAPKRYKKVPGIQTSTQQAVGNCVSSALENAAPLDGISINIEHVDIKSLTIRQEMAKKSA